MTRTLVINSGSSSLKYRVEDVTLAHDGHNAENRVLVSGVVDRIGEAVTGHAAAMAIMLEELRRADVHNIEAVGHRVVHGGDVFTMPTIIDDEVVSRVTALRNLAPLHNPANVAGIVAARAQFPSIPHVAVFDTAFHQTMPPEAYTYAIDRDVAKRFGIRRYGFHGTSHQSAVRRAAEFLRAPLDGLRQIVLHLGNGASMSAVLNGRSVDTTMGMTPLEGLVMGSRSGDIDPGILLHLLREGGYSAESLDTLLNSQSGMLGLSGNRDMRDVLAAAAREESDAQLALDVYIHRIRHYLGAYFVELGGADVVVFTGGVGENEPGIRERVLAGCEWMGIELDRERNNRASLDATTSITRISTPDSRVAVLVLAADEEHEIALQTLVTIAPH